MNDVIVLSIGQFALIYLLLLVILVVMRRCQIHQTKLLLVASMRMTVQLVLAGFVLTFLFENPHPAFTIAYILLMTGFSIYTVLSRNKGFNRRFQVIVGASLAGSGLSVLLFFLLAVVQVDVFHPQYTIPIGGMLMGNTMTGVSLGLRTFRQQMKDQRNKIDTLINLGVAPKQVLSPIINHAVETALLPTLNSMLGMGIISLPGMMTGQILSGTLPTTAILYQIAIMIAITTVVCLAVFCSLFFGARTFYNKQAQILPL